MDSSHSNTVSNLTQIQFSAQETHILSKGLQYNLHYKHKCWIETLALEAETAINHLDTSVQEHLMHLVANSLKH
jgi:hypothetical protein